MVLYRSLHLGTQSDNLSVVQGLDAGLPDGRALVYLTAPALSLPAVFSRFGLHEMHPVLLRESLFDAKNVTVGGILSNPAAPQWHCAVALGDRRKLELSGYAGRGMRKSLVTYSTEELFRPELETVLGLSPLPLSASDRELIERTIGSFLR